MSSKKLIREGLLDRFIDAILKAALRGKLDSIEKSIKQAYDKLTPEERIKLSNAADKAREMLDKKRGYK